MNVAFARKPFLGAILVPAVITVLPGFSLGSSCIDIGDSPTTYRTPSGAATEQLKRLNEDHQAGRISAAAYQKQIGALRTAHHAVKHLCDDSKQVADVVDAASPAAAAAEWIPDGQLAQASNSMVPFTQLLPFLFFADGCNATPLAELLKDVYYENGGQSIPMSAHFNKIVVSGLTPGQHRLTGGEGFFYNDGQRLIPLGNFIPQMTHHSAGGKVPIQSYLSRIFGDTTGRGIPPGCEPPGPAPSYYFTGTLRDAAGRPLSGVNIAVQRGFYGSPDVLNWGSATTDANGRYVIEVRPVYEFCTRYCFGYTAIWMTDSGGRALSMLLHYQAIPRALANLMGYGNVVSLDGVLRPKP